MAATLSVLPDSARVEERLLSLARANGFVAGQPACTLVELLLFSIQAVLQFLLRQA